MKALFALGLVASVAMVGCASTPTTPATTNAQVITKQFLCKNGIAPKLTYVNDSQANITIDGRTTTLAIAPSGSGERYVSDVGVFNHGGEWHQKGNQAVFSYKTLQGVPAETTCEVE